MWFISLNGTLREARVNAGLTQEEIASKIKWTDSGIETVGGSFH